MCLKATYTSVQGTPMIAPLLLAGVKKVVAFPKVRVLASLSIRRTPLTTKDSSSPLSSLFFPRHQFQRTPHPVISQSTEALRSPSLPSPNLPEVRLQPSCQLQKFPTTGDQLSRNSHLKGKKRIILQRRNGFSSNNPSISFSFYLSFRSIVFVKLCFSGRTPLLKDLSINFSF